MLLSCRDHRQIRYSGFNDLVVGSHTVNLYENGEFNIELGLGYNSGTYQVKNDTAFLTYTNSEMQPFKILIKQDELIVLDNSKSTVISRRDNLNPDGKKSKKETITELALPKQLRFSSRMTVVDGSTDNNLNYCEGQIEMYSEMGQYDCSFTIEAIEYNLRSKFIYDSTHQLNAYWSYRSEGPVVYNSENILNDPILAASIGADKIPMIHGNSIIFGDDTTQIESINEKYKLLFMERDLTKKGVKFRIIYEYK